MRVFTWDSINRSFPFKFESNVLHKDRIVISIVCTGETWQMAYSPFDSETSAGGNLQDSVLFGPGSVMVALHAGSVRVGFKSHLCPQQLVEHIKPIGVSLMVRNTWELSPYGTFGENWTPNWWRSNVIGLDSRNAVIKWWRHINRLGAKPGGTWFDSKVWDKFWVGNGAGL